MKDIKAFSDLIVSFSIHEKSGKTVTKIKFRISTNHKNINKPISPNKFLEKIEKITEPKIDLSDPIYSNEIYQLLFASGVTVQETVRNIVNRCVEDEEYKSYIKDTVLRCEKVFEGNPKIKNRGGYIISAIEKDYFKDQRIAETEQAQKDAEKIAESEKRKKIEALVQEGTASFLIFRKPYIRQLREQHLNDATVRAAIEEHITDIRYEKSKKEFDR